MQLVQLMPHAYDNCQLSQRATQSMGVQGAEGGDGSGKGAGGLRSKLRPSSGSQVLNHEPQSGVVLFPKVCSAKGPPSLRALHCCMLTCILCLVLVHSSQNCVRGSA